MLKIPFKILDKSWTLRLLKKKKYKKKNGADSVAMTKLHKRTIDLGPKGMDRETIIHELVHAYLYELCTHSADLSIDALEEIFCEFMSKYGEQCLKEATSLLESMAHPPPQ